MEFKINNDLIDDLLKWLTIILMFVAIGLLVFFFISIVVLFLVIIVSAVTALIFAIYWLIYGLICGVIWLILRCPVETLISFLIAALAFFYWKTRKIRM